MGWPGASVKQADQERVKKEMAKNFGTQCIFLSEELIEKFYHGFCNKTLWPLFHYFPLYAEYENEFWQGYQIVNEQFCNKVLEIYKPGDTIWVHDYHLMLLPGMIRCKIPDAIIGFFLHIPFPSYEMFKLLPRSWSEALLSGIYGSNLIAFHTHNYRTSFLLCTFRILGLKNIMGSVIYNNRGVKVEQFPMGIDYKKFEGAAKSKGVKREQRKLKLSLSSQKLILSIDRQYYTKGILQRLLGFEMFLNSYPEWRGKVVMMMVVIPSRTGVK
ncbi:MAG: trehalose-6-phosphate synthase, partial [Chitinophagales bacterium]|nr:trehalose-6-phosphate synthase [Chitinophagales bacterium]